MGNVSKGDAAQLVAVGFGYVADAQDVSGNNVPNGRGSYVGTSTTVVGATTTGIADPNTPTSGYVNGDMQPTKHPVNGLTNGGYGVTFPPPHGHDDHCDKIAGIFDGHFWHQG